MSPYNDPVIFKSLGDPPFILQMKDKDDEVVELEYNLDGDVIIRTHGGMESPCVPIVKLINALLEINEVGREHDG